MKKSILILFTFVTVFAAYAAPRPFDTTKKSYDPFIGESRGFESMFVNPAGMAGMTDIFTLDIEAGTTGKKSTYETILKLMKNQSALQGVAGGSLDPESAEVVVDVVAENVEQTDLDKLTAGTAYAGMTPEQIAAELEAGNISTADISTLETNLSNNQDVIQKFQDNLLGKLQVEVDAEIKMGTLIKGFGLGIYSNVYSVLDAGSLGFSDLVAEVGAKAGYGFTIADIIKIGVTGDFAVVGDFTAGGNLSLTNIGEILNHTMTYGYAWGIDAGVIIEPLSWLSVGAVMTDIIGSYSPAGTASLNQLSSGGLSPIPFKYNFDLDLDVGVTFKPQIGKGKLFIPSFSVDYYDFIELFRNPPTTFMGAINKHMRIGASLNMLKILNVRAQYYNEYFAVGAGVDLFVIEVFAEFKFKQTFDDIGGSALIKLHF